MRRRGASSRVSFGRGAAVSRRLRRCGPRRGRRSCRRSCRAATARWSSQSGNSRSSSSGSAADERAAVPNSSCRRDELAQQRAPNETRLPSTRRTARPTACLPTVVPRQAERDRGVQPGDQHAGGEADHGRTRPESHCCPSLVSIWPVKIATATNRALQHGRQDEPSVDQVRGEARAAAARRRGRRGRCALGGRVRRRAARRAVATLAARDDARAGDDRRARRGAAPVRPRRSRPRRRRRRTSAVLEHEPARQLAPQRPRAAAAGRRPAPTTRRPRARLARRRPASASKTADATAAAQRDGDRQREASAAGQVGDDGGAAPPAQASIANARIAGRTAAGPRDTQSAW